MQEQVNDNFAINFLLFHSSIEKNLVPSFADTPRIKNVHGCTFADTLGFCNSGQSGKKCIAREIGKLLNDGSLTLVSHLPFNVRTYDYSADRHSMILFSLMENGLSCLLKVG